MVNRTCSAVDCDRPLTAKSARGMCPLHYARFLRHGSVDLPPRRLMSDSPCSVEGCDTKARKRGWCASHYSVWQKTKQEPVPFTYKWAALGGACVVCGDEVPSGSGRRKHCSPGCQVAESRHQGSRPTVATCRLCHSEFSLTRRTGRLQRTDTLWCPDCGRDSPEANRFKRYGVAPEVYADALANGCEICKRIVPSLHIDHDHACCPPGDSGRVTTCGNCVRGFLCGSCNRALGLFRDDVAALKRAVQYLTPTP